MIKNFETIKAQLLELAPAINSFKSEAVQLKIVELIFQGEYGGEGDGAAENPGGQSKYPKKRKVRRARPSGEANVGGDEKVSRRKSGSSGPVVTLNELIEKGFFAKHRTLNEIIEHCNNSKAKRFRPDQLSGPLARSVRDGILKRQKNADAQYEYWK